MKISPRFKTFFGRKKSGSSIRFLTVPVLLCLLLLGCSGENKVRVDVSRIEADTHYLCSNFGSRVTGGPEEKLACDWLEARLQELGFSDGEGTLFRTGFQGFRELESENLMAVCNAGHPGPILCVVAHYDSIEGTPGARDNAASVAIALELARLLGPEQKDCPAEIRFLFPGSEENGYHGARVYVESLSEEERLRHMAVINMDISAATAGEGQLVCCTLGARSSEGYQAGNYLEPMENAVSEHIHKAYQKLYGGEVLTLHGSESDHVKFHQAGIDAANVCWRRVEDGLAVLPSEYHDETDLPETIDYSTAGITASCVFEALHTLAEAYADAD